MAGLGDAEGPWLLLASGQRLWRGGVPGGGMDLVLLWCGSWELGVYMCVA